MEQVTFAMPVSTTMSKADQIALGVNQATAVIVSNYLKHLDGVISKNGVNPVVRAGYVGTQVVLNPTELIALIDSVQSALLTV